MKRTPVMTHIVLETDSLLQRILSLGTITQPPNRESERERENERRLSNLEFVSNNMMT